MKSLNFWRSLFFSALAAAAFGACMDDDEKGDFDASITVDGKKAATVGIVAAGGETAAVSVVSAGAWTLAFEDDQDWCLPNVTSGKGGTTALVFTADPMPEGIEERSVTAVLSAPGWIFGVDYTLTASVTVRQSASGSIIPTTNVAAVRELLKAMNPSETKVDVTEELAAMKITGIVVSEASGVNLGNSSNIAVQDDGQEKNSGLTLNCSQFANLALSAGQVVEIPLSGATVATYGGVLQLYISNTAAVSVIASTDAPAPIVVEPASLLDYESMLVQVDNCYPTAGYGLAWNATGGNNGNINFITVSGEAFVARVGASASFRNELVPELSGSLTGIAGQFNGTLQLSPRTAADIKLTEPIPAPEYKAVTIDQITAAGNYKVENATVVATYAAGFLMQDNTGIILVYPGAGTAENPVTIPAAGKVVTVEGAVSSYGGVLQFGQGSTVTETGTGTVPTPPQAVEITADNIAGYMTAPKVTFVKATGVLNISGSYYNFNFTFESDYTGSISSPNDDLGLTALNNELIDIEGWFVNNGNAGGTGKYFTMIATNVKENTTIPVLTFTSTPKVFAGSNPEPQTVNFTAQNIPDGQSVEFTFDGADKDKFNVDSQSGNSVTISAKGDNDSGTPYTATLVVTVDGKKLAELAVEQVAQLADGAVEVEFDYATITAVNTTVGDVTIACDKGSSTSSPAYNASSQELRIYRYNTFIFSVPEGKKIIDIKFTFSSKSYMGYQISVDSGTYTDNVDAVSGAWTGDAQSVKFTNNGDASTNVQARFKKIVVTYK